jgi:hypothetical protein
LWIKCPITNETAQVAMMAAIPRTTLSRKNIYQNLPSRYLSKMTMGNRRGANQNSILPTSRVFSSRSMR